MATVHTIRISTHTMTRLHPTATLIHRSNQITIKHTLPRMTFIATQIDSSNLFRPTRLTIVFDFPLRCHVPFEPTAYTFKPGHPTQRTELPHESLHPIHTEPLISRLPHHAPEFQYAHHAARTHDNHHHCDTEPEATNL